MIKKLIAICLIASCSIAEQITLGIITDLSWNGVMAKWTKDQPPSGPLIAYYTMDDNASSTTVIDSTGSFNGVAVANTDTKTTTGVLNGALTFDGASDYINLGNNLNFERTDTFTISLWMKYVEGNGVLLNKNEDAWNHAHSGWAFFQGSGTIYFQLNGGTYYGESEIQVYSLQNFNAGTWYMFTVTYDGSSLASGVHIYINGVEYEMGVGQDTLTTSILNTSDALIGANGDFDSSVCFNGFMDDIKIFNSVLSSSEVTTLYETYEPPPSSTTIYFDATTQYPGDATSDGVYADPTSIQYSGTTLDSISTAYTYGAYTFLEWRDSNGTPYYLNDNLPADQTTLYAYWY